MTSELQLSEALREGVVHVWTIGVPLAIAVRDETALACGGLEQRVAWRRAIGRRCRRILADYLDCTPAQLPVDWLAGEKPVFRHGAGQGLSFNLSHSGDRALLAVARHRHVGVDLERVRPIGDIVALARRFLSPEEADRITALVGASRRTAFFRMWTRKEAYVKGLGGNVPADLRRFSILADESGVPRIRRTELEEGRLSSWSVVDLAAPAGYVAAFAIDGGRARIVWFDALTRQETGSSSLRDGAWSSRRIDVHTRSHDISGELQFQ